MQRMLLGLIAVTLLSVGLALWLFASGSGEVMGLALIRLGIMFAVVWLAVPDFKLIFTRFPPWLVFGTVGGLCVIAIRPKTILFVGPILLLLWVIAPKWFGRKPK